MTNQLLVNVPVVQVLQCERQASDSDSGPTADCQSVSASQAAGRDAGDTLSTFTHAHTHTPFLTLFHVCELKGQLTPKSDDFMISFYIIFVFCFVVLLFFPLSQTSAKV